MSQNETETKTETETVYTPPSAAFRLPLFVAMPLAEAAKNVVSCSTCPVSMLCEAAEGGSGWGCPTCKATGVWVDVPEGNDLPKQVIGVDCGKHKFHMRKEAEQITKCSLCSGGAMELEVLTKGPAQYIVFTEYATVSLADRHKQLGDFYEYWKKFYADKAAEEAAKK